MEKQGMDIIKIIEQFPVSGKFVSAERFGNGHINSTFKITFEENGTEESYILQKINTNVFKNPDGLMENVFMVTSHLRKIAEDNGGEPERETLHFIKTKDGKGFCKIDGGCWRMYRMVQDVNCYETATPELFCNAARAFGRFQKLLATLDASKLHETIPFFHHTAHRFLDLEEAIKTNAAGRLNTVLPEIEFLRQRKADCSIVVDALENGELPVRVTHNDTKLNNILMDAKTGEGICIIDLDTIMPGSLLYDFGDSIRFGASSAAEDEKDLDKVYMNLDLFEAYVKGFVSEVGENLTAKEKELLPFSAKLITMETGMRFLTDYLNGDTYFATKYPEHNLDRARTQFKLVADMESKMAEMTEIVNRYC